MGFLDKLFGNKANNSGGVAKERLQVVLVQDRLKIPPNIMEEMQDDIVSVISKYVDIDRDGIDITLTKVARQDCLVANIPVLRSKEAYQ